MREDFKVDCCYCRQKLNYAAAVFAEPLGSGKLIFCSQDHADSFTAECVRIGDAVLRLPDCGDNSCHFAVNRGGMRTNGGCACRHKTEFSYFALTLLNVSKDVQKENDSLRASLESLVNWYRHGNPNDQEMEKRVEAAEKVLGEKG
jgi:hypothetical protein